MMIFPFLHQVGVRAKSGTQSSDCWCSGVSNGLRLSTANAIFKAHCDSGKKTPRELYFTSLMSLK